MNSPMSVHDQLSESLFNKLLKKNMVTSDAFIKASEAQIIQFKKFLIQEAALKTAALYKARKEMVDEVLSLLREDRLNQRQAKRVIILLHRLNMRVTEDGTLEGIHQNAVRQQTSVQCKHLDTEQAPLSACERKKESEERRLKGLKHDWDELNDWLMKISKPASKLNSRGDGHRKKKKSKKTVPRPQFETRFKKPDTIVKKDEGLSRPTVAVKAVHQRNQENVRNVFKSKEKNAFAPLPRKPIGVNQVKIKNDKSKAKNECARLYQNPPAPKLTSEDSKFKNLKKSSVRRTGSFERDPITNFKRTKDSREFFPNLAHLNELDSEDTPDEFTWKQLRKLSFIVDPKESILLERDLIKSIEPSREFILNSADLYEVDAKDSFLEQSTKGEKDFKTRTFDAVNSPETKSSRKKRQELLTHVHGDQGLSSLGFQIDEEESLTEILKFFPILKKSLVADEDCNGNSEDSNEGDIILHERNDIKPRGRRETSFGDISPERLETSLDEILLLKESVKDCNGDSEDSVEGEIVLYERNDTKHHGRSVTIFGDISPRRLEPSLDEILRQEESEQTQRQRISV